MITVPVQIDDVKNLRGFEMTRCTYYSIACDVPTPAALDGVRGKRVPFLAMGLSGVIYKPLGRARLFKTARQIREIFAAIEGSDGLYVDVDDLWIPNAAFEGTPEEHRVRGAIFRVSPEVFRMTADYRVGRIASKDLHDRSTRRRAEIGYSPEETAAFRAWSQDVVSAAKHYYAKNPKMRLKRRKAS